MRDGLRKGWYMSCNLTSCALLALAAMSFGNGTGHNITEGMVGFSKGRNVIGAGAEGMDDTDGIVDDCSVVAGFDVVESDGSALVVVVVVSSPVLAAFVEIK